MAVTVSARYPGLSPQLYDEVVATLDLDANPPIGAILHLAGQSDDGIQVTEIWRTEQAFQAFNDRFVSALQMRGYLSRPTIETAQLHNLFGVVLDTIAGWGAFSLRGRYGGAALLARRTAAHRRRPAWSGPRRLRVVDHAHLVVAGRVVALDDDVHYAKPEWSLPILCGFRVCVPQAVLERDLLRGRLFTKELAGAAFVQIQLIVGHLSTSLWAGW